MRKLFWWIRNYIEGKKIWDAKMSEHLEITIIPSSKEQNMETDKKI
jgi:hypothetical protein